MHKDQIEETYTFNSPGVKNLEVSEEDRQKFAKLDIFMYNRGKEETWKKVVNVKWDKWFSPIANLWEDIGDYEVILSWLSSHGIKDLIRYVDKLDEGSEELRKVKVKEKMIRKPNI